MHKPISMHRTIIIYMAIIRCMMFRAAMARAEPAVVDVHGAVWKGRHDYELVPSAKRYELYEMSYAAKVVSSYLVTPVVSSPGT